MILKNEQEAKSIDKYSKGLKSPNLLGNHPLVGVVILFLSCLTFGILAYFVEQKGALVQWDTAIESKMHDIALGSPVWIKNVMHVGTYLGQQVSIAVGIILGVYFLFKKFWKELVIVLVLYAGHPIIFYFLTKVFARPRPVFDQPISILIKYPSFPSGHMISGVICFGLLAYFFVPKIESRLWKIAVIGFAILMESFIGFSRFFLGAHYITDILAGIAVGIIWTVLGIMIIELFFNKGDLRHVKEKENQTR